MFAAIFPSLKYRVDLLRPLGCPVRVQTLQARNLSVQASVASICCKRSWRHSKPSVSAHLQCNDDLQFGGITRRDPQLTDPGRVQHVSLAPAASPPRHVRGRQAESVPDIRLDLRSPRTEPTVTGGPWTVRGDWVLRLRGSCSKLASGPQASR